MAYFNIIFILVNINTTNHVIKATLKGKIITMSPGKKSIVSTPPIFDKIWKRDVSLAMINPAQIHRRRLIRNYLKQLKIMPKQIMDIGCGTGELLSELLKEYPNAKLTGCDLSIESSNLMKSISPNSEFHCLDVEKLNLTIFKNSFDLITCSEVLEHCNNPRNVIKNAYEWLAPKGLFLVSVPSGFITDYDKTIGHVHHYSTSELKSLLECEGFKNVTAKYWGFPFHMLYRYLVGLASSSMKKNNEEPKQHYLSIWILCKIFNLLFYLNIPANKGYQIFAWGYKNYE